VTSAASQRARLSLAVANSHQRIEPSIVRTVPARGYSERGRVRYAYPSAPVRRPNVLRNAVDRHLLKVIIGLLIAGAVGFTAGVYSATRNALSGSTSVAKVDPYLTSAHETIGARWPQNPLALSTSAKITTKTKPGENANTVVSREWSLFDSPNLADKAQPPTQQTTAKPTVRVASAGAAPRLPTPRPNPAVAPLAAPSRPAPVVAALNPSAVPTEAKTSLVDFQTAPFPYHGDTPGGDHSFLNAGEASHRGHTNFRGHVYWESDTYSDDHVLLHIPAGFDVKKPAVMVVFFHGHGADLARDVRDRQELPAQISAAGMNAVLVAPQFAFDAADSSAGKFWQPDGFKRFLDEAAQKLAAMYGDPRGAFTFATMPIVLVSYSGGFGPTLAVLDRGGANARLRGLVMLDSLYAGFDNFADWIAKNRSAFFISSYTTHTEGHNSTLKHLLAERSIAYGSELKSDHLAGSVTFLPEGDISHRDFVNRAWAHYPVADILSRMSDVIPQTGGSDLTASVDANAGKRN
jgi:hypothetical protein